MSGLARGSALFAFLLSQGFPVVNMRFRANLKHEPILAGGADPTAAQAAADAWVPTRRDKLAVAAEKRGLTPYQLAALRVTKALEANEVPPPWALSALNMAAQGADGEIG